MCFKKKNRHYAIFYGIKKDDQDMHTWPNKEVNPNFQYQISLILYSCILCLIKTIRWFGLGSWFGNTELADCKSRKQAFECVAYRPGLYLSLGWRCGFHCHTRSEPTHQLWQHRVMSDILFYLCFSFYIQKVRLVILRESAIWQ